MLSENFSAETGSVVAVIGPMKLRFEVSLIYLASTFYNYSCSSAGSIRGYGIIKYEPRPVESIVYTAVGSFSYDLSSSSLPLSLLNYYIVMICLGAYEGTATGTCIGTGTLVTAAMSELRSLSGTSLLV